MLLDGVFLTDSQIGGCMLSGMQAGQRLGEWARVEDWLLAGSMAVVSPLLVRLQNSNGPFDPGRPLDGILGIAAVIGALACMVTTSSDRPDDGGPNILERAAVGPLVGGLLLVTISASDGLDLSDTAGKVVVALAAVLIVAVRLRWPKLPTAVRRGLVTPFTLVAGNLFGVQIHELTGGSNLAASLGTADLGAVGVVLGFFALFAAVFYTMLIYAPRQVAEAEGGPMTWIWRFVLFVAGTAFGLGWLAVLGG